MGKTDKRFCVYGHLDKEGKFFYIGSGNERRPYRTDNRNYLWNDFIKNKKNSYTIYIFYHNLTNIEAYNKEIELIKKLKPRFNIYYNNIHLHKNNGKIRTAEMNKKNSESKKGIKKTYQQRINISNGKNPNKIMVIDKKTNNLIGIFNTHLEVSKATNIKRSAISNVLCGLNKTTRKYYIKYMEI